MWRLSEIQVDSIDQSYTIQINESIRPFSQCEENCTIIIIIIIFFNTLGTLNPED